MHLNDKCPSRMDGIIPRLNLRRTEQELVHCSEITVEENNTGEVKKRKRKDRTRQPSKEDIFNPSLHPDTKLVTHTHDPPSSSTTFKLEAAFVVSVVAASFNCSEIIVATAVAN